MATFNKTPTKPASGLSPVRSEAEPGAATTALGAPGVLRNAESELYLLAVSSLDLTYKAFHEDRDARLHRFRTLVREIAVSNPAWLVWLLGFMRQDLNLRTAPLIGACEFVKARKDARLHGHSRAAVRAALGRADEPGEMLAYWTSRYGRALPAPMKRGIADKLAELYSEWSLLKHDSPDKPWRFADVIELTHPKPAPAEAAVPRSALYQHAIDRRHNRPGGPPPLLRMLCRRKELMALPVTQRRPLVLGADGPDVLRQAGMTWESLAGWVQGPMDAAMWEAILPHMNYMARVRNLRNLEQAGVASAVLNDLATYLADPVQVAKSRQLPFRFLAAHRVMDGHLRWGWPLEQALNHSLANIPELPGRTLVLVDRSPSMWMQKMSEHSTMSWADGAAVFGAALALRAEQADLIEFGETSYPVEFTPGESVLRVVNRLHTLGGTNIPGAVERFYRSGFHHRVVIVTDEQTRPKMLPPSNRYGSDGRHVPIDYLIEETVPVYVWNFGGYETGFVPTGVSNRHCFGGLTDAGFKVIPLLEKGITTGWKI